MVIFKFWKKLSGEEQYAMKIEKIPIKRIKIKDRIRIDLGDLVALKESIKKYGLFNPIQVDIDLNIISGHRRLQAMKELGFTCIDATVVDNETRIDRLEMELQENILRKDLTDEELRRSIQMKYRLMKKERFSILWQYIKKFFSFIISIFTRR